jgi:hypothetical protein
VEGGSVNRRHFLRSLAIGVACLQLRFRPETAAAFKYDGALTLEQFNAYLERVFRVTKHTHPPMFLVPAGSVDKWTKILNDMYRKDDR